MRGALVVVAVLALAGCGDDKAEEVSCQDLALAVCDRACECGAPGCAWAIATSIVESTETRAGCEFGVDFDCRSGVRKTQEVRAECLAHLEADSGVCQEGAFTVESPVDGPCFGVIPSNP